MRGLETKLKRSESLSVKEVSKWASLKKRFAKQKVLFLLLIPCVAFYIIFNYIPILGNVIAFQDYNLVKGISGSDWVGLDNFVRFIQSPYCFRVIKNTLLLNIYSLLIEFPIPIIFALLLNEVIHDKYKKIVQTLTYLPHFIATVIVVGLMKNLLAPGTGPLAMVLQSLGVQEANFFMSTDWFRTLYIGSSVWTGFSWGAIIYLAVIANVDTQLYEAVKIDGGGKLRCTWHVTLPSLRPTIIILLIMRIGNLMNLGFEKVLLMYNPATYEVSDVISTYVYRTGLTQANYSFGAAVGLMNSVICIILLVGANYFSKKYAESSLW